MLSVFDKNLKNIVLKLVFLTGLMISNPLMAGHYDQRTGQWIPDYSGEPEPARPSAGQYQQPSGGSSRPQANSGGFSATSAPTSTVQFSFSGPQDAFGTFIGGGSGGGKPSSGGFSSSSSSLLLTQPIGPSSSGTFPSGGGSSPLQSFQRPNYSSTLQSGGGLAQFAPASQNTFQPSSSFYRPQYQQQRPSPLTASSLASLSQQYNQPSSPISAADFASIGDESESNVGDDGFGLEDDETRQQRPALDVSRLASKTNPSSYAGLMMPTVVPQKQGLIGRVFNSNQDVAIKSITDSNAQKKALMTEGIDPNNKDEYFTFRGEQIPRADADKMINDAERVNELLDTMLKAYKDIENLYNDISGKLVSYVEKQRLNAEGTFKNFMALFGNDKYAVGHFKEMMLDFKEKLNQMFQQVLGIYEDIGQSNSKKIEEMNNVLANFSLMSRQVKQETFDVLKLKEARTTLTNFFDAASRFVNK